MVGGIHYEDPFATPVEKREPWRRLRGRLASPVTLWTSGSREARTGLTISSVVVADGQPPSVLGLMKDTSDLFASIQESGRFVVHVVERDDRALADRFAGLRPSPGGLFAGEEVEDSEWVPVLTRLVNRAYCRFVSERAAGYQRLVEGTIEQIDLDELESPLVLFRGRY
ncbi:MAG TPA: flavin reductase family protein, partial [Actinomycetota bacterium]|nr:flavin reductase family protein [Actinomycetota bacterium]